MSLPGMLMFGLLLIAEIALGIRIRVRRRGRLLLGLAGAQLLVPVLAIFVANAAAGYSESEGHGWVVMIGAYCVELLLGLAGFVVLTLTVIGLCRARAET